MLSKEANKKSASTICFQAVEHSCSQRKKEKRTPSQHLLFKRMSSCLGLSFVGEAIKTVNVNLVCLLKEVY